MAEGRSGRREEGGVAIQLPASTEELVGQQGHLFDSSFLFTLSKDDEGTEIFSIKMPGKAARMIHNAIATRRLPLSNVSEFVRAAVGHYLYHVAARLNDPQLHMEWLWLEQAGRAAWYAKEAEQVKDIVGNLAIGLRVALERADPEMAQEMLERFFDPVMAAKTQDPSRTRMVVHAAMEDPSISNAIDWVRKHSTAVQEAYEYGKES